jgi:hypothetical protein
MTSYEMFEETYSVSEGLFRFFREFILQLSYGAPFVSKLFTAPIYQITP